MTPRKAHTGVFTASHSVIEQHARECEDRHRYIAEPPLDADDQQLIELPKAA